MSALRKSKHHVSLIFLVFFLTSILYWRLNKLGYCPPIGYFFTEVKSNKVANSSSNQRKIFNYERSLANLIPSPIDKSQTAIKIDKSNYQLTLYYQNQAVKSYPVVFGQNPVGDKRQEGDFKTPEGIFQVRDLYPHTSWSKFIWLDYPTQESWRKHLQAKKEGKISLLSTVGSEIGIHGVPQNSDYLIDEQTNWTWGCISLKNKDVDEIYKAIQTGTKIEILP